MTRVPQSAEQNRLDEARQPDTGWQRWGPYLSERQWGTLREDYSADGDSWAYFTHDIARSRAYRWGEDGIAGFSDDQQRLCLSLALWNGRDPFLKERLFGLDNAEGNHGEDVKECYYYLDATPTHSYLKMLYKYPQCEFPYAKLTSENQQGSKFDAEYELVDSGVFDKGGYFDVFVEYAKVGPDDILMAVHVHNRGAKSAEIHVIPQASFRNTWSWKKGVSKPEMALVEKGVVAATHRELEKYYLHAEEGAEWLFCDNETNVERVHDLDRDGRYYKDGFHEYIVDGMNASVNPLKVGTKVGAHHRHKVPAGGMYTVRLRLSREKISNPFVEFDDIMNLRRAEADAFYEGLQASIETADQVSIHRMALAGMIWNKQFYHYVVWEWLKGDPLQPAPPKGYRQTRNTTWEHLSNADIVSMPDKWEFPWYAAWDLAFHCVPFALIDIEFAKSQILLLTRERYMHPNGQLPSHEGALGAVNPPVHAWAAWEVFQIERQQAGGAGDLGFLERIFHKLMLNFTWWVNRTDAHELNVFQGGFLGLDNISVFDRGAPLPTGGHIDQADGTSWMAMYSLNMMRIALELGKYNPTYVDLASKFFQHFLYISKAMHHMGEEDLGLWDDEDEFFYDVLNHPEEGIESLKVRSIIGLIPLFSVTVLDPGSLNKLPEFYHQIEEFLVRRPDLAELVPHWQDPGEGDRRLLALVRGKRLRAILKRMLDESEFLSPYGIRALSKYHAENPYTYSKNGHDMSVTYRPGESVSDTWGGNSNWRGPIWFPINYLIISSLRTYYAYYGDTFKIECPTGSGQYCTLEEVAAELTSRLSRLFTRDEEGRRAVFGDNETFQTDPNFKDYVLFHEYFHGDTGRGCGASHQTGWTGLIANLLQTAHRQAPAPRESINESSVKV